MTVQDDKAAGQGEDQQAGEGQKATEKPEPDENAKRKAAEMMTAYDDRPTVVLPGSGGKVSGTAVNAWLDEDGNPKYNEGPDDTGSADEGSDDKDREGQSLERRTEKGRGRGKQGREALSLLAVASQLRHHLADT
jgi:hypothetical protein